MLNRQTTQGFTLVELMIVIAIIGILSAIAYPLYLDYVTQTKRTDMMTELQNIGGRIQAQKLANGSYSGLTLQTVNSNRNKYPYSGGSLYTISAAGLQAGTWRLTADPISGTAMEGDGSLTLDYRGEKCHETKCSFDDGWK